MENANFYREKGGGKMIEFLKSIWAMNGILAGIFTLIVQLIGIVGAIFKCVEKK